MPLGGQRDAEAAIQCGKTVPNALKIARFPDNWCRKVQADNRIDLKPDIVATAYGCAEANRCRAVVFAASYA
jgi:hypothetical protein